MQFARVLLTGASLRWWGNNKNVSEGGFCVAVDLSHQHIIDLCVAHRLERAGGACNSIIILILIKSGLYS